VLQAVSSSFASTASFVALAQTASYVVNAQTASFVATAQTASYVLNAVSSSFASTASYYGGSVVSASYATTASYVENAQTASYYNGSVVSASYALSSSYAVTASYAETASFSLATTENRILVINKSGATITKGMVVHLTGSSNSSDTPYVITASYESDSLSANTLGIASQTITFNSTGYVTTEGVLTGINVTGFVSGQVLYLGPTGSILGTAPQAPLHGVRLGQVVRDSPSNNGSIYVRIDNGYELGELHDILDTTTTSSYGDLLVRSGSVWTNSKQLTGSYAITGSLTATSFTGSLNGTASHALQAISASFASTASFVNPLNQTLVLTGSLNTYKSGSNVVAISGSTGVLFSVDDVVSGSLFTVWTGSTPILQVNSGLTTTITGSLSVSGGITGSLFGTASWANNATTASFVTLAQTASFVTTAQTASTVTVTDTTGCADTACVRISVDLECGELFVPNAFSPNNDQSNDVFRVKINPVCVKEMFLVVYDRWGEKMCCFKTRSKTKAVDFKLFRGTSFFF
jgi:hypothetical protein